MAWCQQQPVVRDVECSQRCSLLLCKTGRAYAGKILAILMLNRLNEILDNVLPESQCGFRSGRDTADMIFTARLLQQKAREQHCDLST